MKIFISTVLVFYSLISVSQEKHSFGVKGGYQFIYPIFSHQFFAINIDTKLTGGAHGGFVYRNLLGKNVGLQLDVSHYQKGWVQDFDRDTADFRNSLNYNRLFFGTCVYLNLFKGKARMIFNLGPYVELIYSH